MSTARGRSGIESPRILGSRSAYPVGFEDDKHLRSAFIRELTLHQREHWTSLSAPAQIEATLIPRKLVKYWHDPHDIPDDVRVCLESWDRLREDGFEVQMFDDAIAEDYIANIYGASEHAAFARCRHPAMRSDYFRMCYILAEGGFYVDADDVLLEDGWRQLFLNGKLNVQPLCYDIPTNCMVPADEIWEPDLPTSDRIFYVNNNPIVAPPHHPILRRALTRATERLLADERLHEIQSTTGPGNLTAALAAHARGLNEAGIPFDFELIRNWDGIAETRWELSYRNDSRNWRHMRSD
jgi:mannosyltransferase OCH1-like enzyme